MSPRLLASASLLALCGLLGPVAGCAEEPLVLDCMPGLTWNIEEQRCEGWDTGEELVEAEPVVAPLAAPALLRRLSLDLRGTLPTVAELEAVEADEAALDGLLDAMLEDPALEERLVLLLNEEWQTLVDDFVIQAGDAGFEREEEFLYERSVGEEPLRLMARVAVEDRPWTETLTADWTMANEAMTRMWPVALEDEGDGEGDEEGGDEGRWQRARYVDSRPAAGVLATNGLWWRYDSNNSNLNRGRAAALTRLLVCADYHGRPVTFTEVDLSSGSQDASQVDPACTGCHAGIDPIASALFGFTWTERHSLLEVSWYHAEREPLGEEALGVAPAWFGQPADSLTALAARVAEDERFPRCTSRNLASALLRRHVDPSAPDGADLALVEALTRSFAEEDLRLKALLRAIVATPEYRAGSLTEAATEEDAARIATRRVLVASQLSTAVEELTGYRWTLDGTSMLHEDEVGVRVLAGDMDGRYVQGLASEPTLTWVIAVRRLAELAADHVVREELSGTGEGGDGDGGGGRLLGDLDASHRPGDAAFEAALETTWWRLHAERLDDETRDGLVALWSEVAELSGPEEAWRATLGALLRDPAWLEY